ncbi:MAG: hypothetical protein A3E38_01850 [Candidatus Moranbacteria bacterium RIFCSPHIGHO2_12_FULL_54_9]|nr:MAG: hypothetical protein A2878_02585 [Candidatus Moranbacteria bacterium RIFCSPHIGHO2_01_FULL_54_31]OGI26425.1 MAG: hypothetical protein A3E38_01850 [Candidatus Moranbacteria bacterium RIFCSPHIGHO2_12_FULL_54_9]
MKKNQESGIKNHGKQGLTNPRKIKFFETRIADFFRKAGREHLPWRKQNITAYEVWVSEIMLQQTQVSRVTSYYAKFLKRFPTVRALAKADWEEFLPYYDGLGYYDRGRNMLKAAQVIAKEYAGTFPRDKKLLEKLPGIGPYTAAAIMSFAYGDEHLAWDTNLKRVIGRFFLGGKQLVSDEQFWEDAFQTSRKTLNAALMDFGSALCVGRPKCEACALQSACVYYREQGKREKKRTTNGRRLTAKKIDWKEAQAYVFLHENHKKFFSSLKMSFKPFILPSGYNTRAGIKQYFRDTYGLALSVRPPHRKMSLQGRPTLLVNAQILSGQPRFKVFSKKAKEEYTENIGHRVSRAFRAS